MYRMIPYLVKMLLLTDFLGTKPSDQKVYERFVLEKARKKGLEVEGQDELDSLPYIEDRGTTVFSRTQDGQPAIWGYMVKSFYESACSALRRGDSDSKELRAYIQAIKDNLFITPRLIPIAIPAGKEAVFLERPLRAKTPQGERSALAKSELVPAGASFEFTMWVLEGCAITDDCLHEWDLYAMMSGLGQWRKGGNGRVIVTRHKGEPESADTLDPQIFAGSFYDNIW